MLEILKFHCNCWLLWIWIMVWDF